MSIIDSEGRSSRVLDRATIRLISTTRSQEFKVGIVAMMLPPNAVPVLLLVQETAISMGTLYTFRSKAHRDAQGATVDVEPGGRLRIEEKFAVVVGITTLNEVKIGEFCHHKGSTPR